MATYKVIQDIEAEDKLLGPLTLKQFIFAIIVIVSLFVAFRLSAIHPILGFLMLPHSLVFGFLAAPFGKDQPNEVWLAAKIRFFIKPRVRIWNQSGIKNLVTITAPKKVEQHLTKGFSQTEVRSRLMALANTIDSHGWAVKNVNVNLFAQPTYTIEESDRLVAPSSLPQEVSNVDVAATDDIFDTQNNVQAQKLSQMVQKSSQAHHQQAVSQMSQPAQPQPANYWFMNEPEQTLKSGYTTGKSSVISPDQNIIQPTSQPTVKNETSSLSAEQALLAKIHSQKSEPPTITNSHMKTVQPLGNPTAVVPNPPPAINNSTGSQTPNPPLTPTPNPVIMDLAKNDDLNVSTIARQANKSVGQSSEDEVVVSLHDQ